jgi:hypothetical protein
MRFRPSYLPVALVGLACATVAVPPPPSDPQLQAPTHLTKRDSAALASLDSFIVVLMFRRTCRMPVARGDHSNDTLMVGKRRPRGQPGPVPWEPCYNPLFWERARPAAD